MVVEQVKEKRNLLNGNVLGYMEYLEKRKLAAGKTGTASLYRTTRHHLERFLGNGKFSFKKVTTILVKDFVASLQSLSLSKNSVNNYTSIFRASYNAAVSDNLLTPLDNPFNTVNLRPIQTYKRAINSDVFKEILYLNLKGRKRLDFARDLFVFSFMACGMAFIDLAHLTRANIYGNVLIYHRIKTKAEIRVTITPGMHRLIEKYADTNSELLFPVLKSSDVSYEKYKVALRTYNRRLDKIGNMLSEPIKLTSYVARHSWAMCAKENDISTAIISQAMGHASEKTTAFYLSSFGQLTMERANLKIIGFVEEWVMGDQFTF